VQVVKNWGELRVRQSLRETFALMRSGKRTPAAGHSHG
jgi:hypothetical protein